MENDNKAILILIIISIIGLLVIGYSILNNDSNSGETPYITDIVVEESPNITFTQIKGTIGNVAINSKISKDYVVEVKLYGSDGNLLDKREDKTITRINDKKGYFSVGMFKTGGEKVEIILSNVNGDVLASTIYYVNSSNKTAENKTESSSSLSDSSSFSSNSSSSSSSSSSPSGTFKEGFTDGVTDAYYGRSCKYSYGAYYFGDDEYKSGYADGYQSYLQDPNTYKKYVK